MDAPVHSPQESAAPPGMPPAAWARLQQAMQAHQDGRLQEAQQLYEEATALAPEDPDVLHMHGVLMASRGQFERAAAAIARAIEVKPGVAIFHNNLGNTFMQLDQLDEAEQHYRQAIILDSDRIDAMNNLGVLLGRRRQHADAEKVFVRLLELAPQFSDARQNLAQLYITTDRLQEAVQQCLSGLVTAPHNRSLRHVLGLAYGALGWADEAKELYRKWLEEEPGNARAAHHYAAHTGVGVPEVASPAYVCATFDNFADSFESQLAKLDYRAPALVGEALAQALGAPQADLRIADAGCGTGLCATYLKPYTRQLVGVDLSGPMLARAAVKQAYDELCQGDLVEFLQGRERAFDAIVSADTLCYFGLIDAFAAAARLSLIDGGWLIFTVEALEDEHAEPPWRLQTHGRYQHRRAYVEQALGRAGFVSPRIEHVTLRSENLKPVMGWLVAATAG